jgi:hypothetical protein
MCLEVGTSVAWSARRGQPGGHISHDLSWPDGDEDTWDLQTVLSADSQVRRGGFDGIEESNAAVAIVGDTRGGGRTRRE